MTNIPSARIIPFPAKTEPAGRALLSLQGSALLNRILEDRHPEKRVQGLAGEDFFWIVKKIGDEDCLPLLELASEEQWEYLLDLSTWEGDALDADQTLAWLRRLAEADADRFSSWLFDSGEALFSLILLRKAEVVARDGQEEGELPRGYFTLDGRYFIRALNPDDHETIETLLRILSARDPEGVQHLLFRLAAILPAEAEEELYRRRNVRLAEYGFPPAEEAVGIYAPLAPAALGAEKPPLLPGGLAGGGMPVPQAALMHIEEGGLVSTALSRIDDPLMRDRIHLEVSGLCNRILAADSFAGADDPEQFACLCRRAGGYVNAALESLCGSDIAAAAAMLKNHSLETIFRVGYGFAMALHREARQWRRESWFRSQGRENGFWGNPWAQTLDGLLLARPQFFAGEGAQASYRDFAGRADLDEAGKRLRQIRALDRMLARLSAAPSAGFPPGGEWTFHPLLFNRWACKILGKEPSTVPLTPAKAARFFGAIRQGEAGPPYRMAGWGETFTADFMAGAAGFEPELQEALEEALSLVWEQFRSEYEAVAEEDLDGRLSRLILISLP